MQRVDLVEQQQADLSIDLLKILLIDKTTKKNIVWATDEYSSFGSAYYPHKEILPELITGPYRDLIQPRVKKSLAEQIRRTRDKAEVFTPSWVCNIQNNLIDAAWFLGESPFNTELEKSWETNTSPIMFPQSKTWMDYVYAKRLEISCGEAPYLVSRYDAVTGEQIPLMDRIGLLDRKLRVVYENTSDYEDWFFWTTKAFESIYGYDYQGDNVLLARENLLYTFIDNYQFKFMKEPSLAELKKIATIISWNIWQMDGLSFTTPYSEDPDISKQVSFFELLGEKVKEKTFPMYSKIYDWSSNKIIEFREI